MQDQVEVTIGKRSWEHKGQNLIEKIRFKGERLGHYTSDTELDDSRLNRRETIYTLYHCPDGYLVAHTLLDSKCRRERARWSKKEALTELLPKADGTDGDAPMLGASTAATAKTTQASSIQSCSPLLEWRTSGKPRLPQRPRQKRNV